MNTLTPLPQAVRAVQALSEVDTCRTRDSMGKSQPRPIEVVNRAESFFECTRKPSCVKINIYHSPNLAQGEAANLLFRCARFRETGCPGSAGPGIAKRCHNSQRASYVC